jgi:hypothetical protein
MRLLLAAAALSFLSIAPSAHAEEPTHKSLGSHGATFGFQGVF